MKEQYIKQVEKELSLPHKSSRHGARASMGKKTWSI